MKYAFAAIAAVALSVSPLSDRPAEADQPAHRDLITSYLTSSIGNPGSLYPASALELHRYSPQTLYKVLAADLDPYHFHYDQVQCLAENIYWEAKTESFSGRIAVAHVTLNRLRDPYYPKTICKVVHQVLSNGVCMFSWVCQGVGKPTIKKEWDDIQLLAAAMYYHPDKFNDNTGNATFFHATYLGNYWPHLKRTVKIEGHVFYKKT